jgi:hypothetical protein
LFDLPQWLEVVGDVEPYFFSKLAAGRADRIFAGIDFALGNGPGAQVLASPEGPARMGQQYLYA